MINKKISTIAGSLIIIAIVLALGFSFLALNKKEEIQNQNNINQVTENKNNKDKSDEEQFKELNEQELAEMKELTKDWKTFRDQEYGYEFKYPQDYYIEKNKYNKDIDEVSIISSGKCTQNFNEKCNVTIRTLSPEDERVKNMKESYDQNTTRFFIDENKITYQISDGLNAMIQAKQKIYFITSLSYPKEIEFIFQGIYSTFKENK